MTGVIRGFPYRAQAPRSTGQATIERKRHMMRRPRGMPARNDLTTQSHALFEMAAQGTRALLGREALR